MRWQAAQARKDCPEAFRRRAFMPPISADGLAASIFGRRKAPLARP